MAEKVSFLATFPSVMSAIKVTGDGSGMRIMLDIPETEMAEAVKLMLYRQVVLRVTVEIDENLKNKLNQDGKSNGQGRVSEGQKRQSKWETTEE